MARRARSGLRRAVLRLPALLLLLSGCHAVRGGSPEEQAMVEEELASFEAASRIEVTVSVRIAERGRSFYRKPDRHIRLAPSATLRTDFRHELCHAYDLQGADASQDDDRLIVEGVEGVKEYKRDKLARREAFARFCSLGPETLRWLGRCTAEHALTSEWRDLVFDQLELPPSATLAEGVGVPLAGPRVLEQVQGLDDGLLVHLRTEQDTQEFWVVNPTAGTYRSRTTELGLALPRAEPGGPEGWSEIGSVAVDAGAARVLSLSLEQGWHLWAGQVERHGTASVLCLDGDGRFAEFAGQLWWVAIREGELVVSRVELPG